MAARRLAKPIFTIEKEDAVEQPKKHIAQEEAMDIVLINDHSDESIEEIELVFAANKNQFESPAKFWNWIDELKWKDIRWRYSHHYRNNVPKLNDFNIASIKSLKKHFWKYFNDLKTLFEEKNVFGSLERELTDYEKNQLISHIVAKGQVYYATIMSEPYFCGALVSKKSSSDEFDDFLKYM